MNIARRHSPTITFLTQDELKRLMAVIKDKRDRSIILLAYRHGLPPLKIGLLQRTDLDLKLVFPVASGQKFAFAYQLPIGTCPNLTFHNKR